MIMDRSGDEMILSVGFEGGGLTLFRRSATGNSPSYYVELNQVALAEMLEEDEGSIAAVARSRIVPSLSEALAVLDETPDWVAMYVSDVAPEYGQQILAAVESRMSRIEASSRRATLARWRERCRSTP